MSFKSNFVSKCVNSTAFEVSSLSLVFISLVTLVIDTEQKLSPTTQNVLDHTEYVIGVLFVIEYCLLNSNHKKITKIVVHKIL